ncbi:MAG: D-alanyl-D-alanine carboxypeptidase family protein [Bacillota bacterium]|nr:D-alanyl-D-alanine carboxypeptidase family protein [Bacillota bacterium]
MKKLLTVLIIVSILLISVIPAFSEPASPNGLDINAKACILIDSKTGQVLYQLNADTTHLYPASTTKMMTAIIAIENSKPDQIMTASQKAIDDIGDGGMNIGIMPGEQLTMQQLLEPLLISSANEAANILSENVFSSQSEFIDKMNEKAQEIGATNTHFLNPNGMQDPDHYTTARDLSTIARYAMTLPLFKETVEKTQYKLDPTNKHSEWPVLGTGNTFLYRKSHYYTKALGIKTGYTTEAGHNLVAAAANDSGMELIAVVMGVFVPNAKVKANEYCQDLLDYGFKNYSIQQVSGANEPVQEISDIKDAKDNTALKLVTAASVSSVLPNDKNEWNIEKTKHLNQDIKAPINKGTALGYIEYKRNGILLGKTDIVAANDILVKKSVQFKNKMSNIVNSIKNSILFITCVILLAALVLLWLIRKVLKMVSRSLKTLRRKN